MRRGEVYEIVGGRIERAVVISIDEFNQSYGGAVMAPVMPWPTGAHDSPDVPWIVELSADDGLKGWYVRAHSPFPAFPRSPLIGERPPIGRVGEEAMAKVERALRYLFIPT